jgi:hypothetical protein
MSMTKNIRYALIRVGIGALAVLFLLAFMTLAGCTSGTKDIARAANNTNELAQRIGEDARIGKAALQTNPQDVSLAVQSFDKIAQSARDINHETKKVHEALSKVEDTAPWWASALGNLTILAAILAAAILAIKFWPVLAVFLAGVKWLEWLIPKPTRIAAERDYELYREADEPHRDAQRDRILAARMNPYYDAAWRRAERKARLGAKA